MHKEYLQFVSSTNQIFNITFYQGCTVALGSTCSSLYFYLQTMAFYEIGLMQLLLNSSKMYSKLEFGKATQNMKPYQFIDFNVHLNLFKTDPDIRTGLVAL